MKYFLLRLNVHLSNSSFVKYYLFNCREEDKDSETQLFIKMVEHEYQELEPLVSVINISQLTEERYNVLSIYL